MSDWLITALGAFTVGFFVEAVAVAWKRRPMVVRSEALGRWIAARSQDRIEAP